MKFKNVIFIIILSFCFLLSVDIYASDVKTYERTETNLRIRESIKVTSSNKNIILKTPSVDASKKVYDFAELLSDEEETKLYNNIQTFIEKYDMDMVIATIDDNNKSSSRDWADDFYDYNDFGIGTNYDGLLFLIDMDNRKMWISTTGHAILVYSDTRIDDILDDTYDYISKKNYYMCANAFITSASNYAKKGVASSNSNYEIDENGKYVRKDEGDLFTFLPVAIIISGIGTFVFILVAVSKHKTIAKATKASQYVVKNSLNLSAKDDRFLKTYTSKTYSPQSSDSDSGGSSTHSSSSGSDHGGGGRSF